MLLLRLLTTTLCVTCVVLIATFEPIRITVMPPAAPPAAASVMARDLRPPLSVIDVADGVAPSQLAALIQLRPNERITAVNDRELDSDVEADEVLAALAPHRGGFVDLTVATASTERRILVLLHGETAAFPVAPARDRPRCAVRGCRTL